ncbi:hypothetical protein [Asticcacaulis sp. EMRT-3]|uniref:hypothetical protein n=1 Tax=Asticcacaulis sp. EMRT-3 TaxID=3040349 RepID=UPI0024AE9580|nr:hypothetical protein [Asticcacaulis sp. EMRT-3]MDI7775512.1 hypothetical protein [Asticcacaulis sp. EMRT-3]
MSKPDFSRPPHSRNDATGETARLAAIYKAATAPKQRERVYGVLLASGYAMTPEQITRALHEAGGHDLLMSIRPRCSELARMGLIRDSGERGIGEGGCKAIKWQAVTTGTAEGARDE